MSLRIRPFDVADTAAVVALWRAVGLTRPWNDPYRDIARTLEVQPELFVVAVDGGRVVGTVMAGYDGHRGWMYYLATADDRRGEGIGRSLVAHVEQELIALGCPKVQLMVRPDNTAARGFYDALGYEPEEIWLTGKRLIPDDGSMPIDPAVTPDDNGHVIVSVTAFSDDPLDSVEAFRSDRDGWRTFRYDLGTISFDEPDWQVSSSAFESAVRTLLDVLADVPEATWEREAAEVRVYVSFPGGAHTLPRPLVRQLSRVNATVWIDS